MMMVERVIVLQNIGAGYIPVDVRTAFELF